MVDISIVIPSYRSEEIIEKVLDSIFLQSTAVSYEVILVDSSSDSRVDVIASKFEKLIFLKQNSKTSASKSRNLGASKASGKLLLFIDSDVTLDQGVLDLVWSEFRNGKRVFSCCHVLGKTPSFSIPNFLEFSFFFSESFEGNPNRIRKNLSASFLVVDPEIFKQIGPFEEVGRGEDAKLTEKIAKNGNNLYFCPNIKVTFHQQVTFLGFLKKCWLNGINFCYLRFTQLTFAKRVLVFFVAPLLALYKFSLMTYRNLSYRHNMLEILIFLFFLPLIAFANFIWFLGIIYTTLLNKGIDTRH